MSFLKWNGVFEKNIDSGKISLSFPIVEFTQNREYALSHFW